MTSILKNNLSTKILLQITKWQVLTLSDLFRLLPEQGNKDSIRRVVNDLIKKGFLKSQSVPSINSKIITGTEKLMLYFGDKDHDSTAKYIAHNAIVNTHCIDFLYFENVDEVITEKDINSGIRELGEIAPDAEADLYFQEKNQKVAIEFELTQKCKKKLTDKFLKYSQSTYYDYIFFTFADERMARNYANHLIDIKNSANPTCSKINIDKFIFSTKSKSVSSESFSGSFNVSFPHNINLIDELLGPIGSII